MADERTESPNMLAPEQGRPVEVEPKEAAEPAPVAVEVLPPAAPAPAPETPSNVVETPKREVAAALKVEKDPIVQAVDGILEEKLGKFFDGLDASQQAKFVAIGEALTANIAGQIRTKKTDFPKILDAVTDWLHQLPMLNKDFLRQEAWIKTQAIMQFAENESSRHDLAA